MEQIILIAHLLVALAIIGLIMLQQGKGADMGASFGAGSSQTLFGSDGSGNVLTRATTWLVVLFFCTSLGLAIIANQRTSPVDDLGLEIPTAVQEEAAPLVAEELPQFEEDLPQLEEALPAATSAPGDDLPSLDE